MAVVVRFMVSGLGFVVAVVPQQWKRGKIIYDNAPPIPTFRLEGDHGEVLWTSEDVLGT